LKNERDPVPPPSFFSFVAECHLLREEDTCPSLFFGLVDIINLSQELKKHPRSYLPLEGVAIPIFHWN
jgi:hypothetical protein